MVKFINDIDFYFLYERNYNWMMPYDYAILTALGNFLKCGPTGKVFFFNLTLIIYDGANYM